MARPAAEAPTVRATTGTSWAAARASAAPSSSGSRMVSRSRPTTRVSSRLRAYWR